MEIADTTIGWRLVNPKMKDAYGVDPLGITAENVAEEYQISRADQDAREMALRSQQRAARANAEGRFAEEIVPLTVKTGKKTMEVATDERPPGRTPHWSNWLSLNLCSPREARNGRQLLGDNDGATTMIIASEGLAVRLG